MRDSTWPIVILIAIFSVTVAGESDWPGKRGPRDNWSTDAPVGFPGTGVRVAWRAQVGTGSSGVAVVGNALVTIGNQDNQDSVCCFDTVTGGERWRVRYPAKLEERGYEGGPNANPTIVGDRVFTLSRQGLLLCLALADGHEVWRHDLVADRVPQPNYGFSSAPVLADGLVVLNIGAHGRAFDAASGVLRWESGLRADGYSSAVVAMIGNERAVLIFSRTAVSAARLADGKKLWSQPWAVKHAVADPLLVGERVLVTHAYGSGSILLDLATGERERAFPQMCFAGLLYPPVRIGEHLYGSSGDKNAGDLRCLSLDGTVRWRDHTLESGNSIAVGNWLVMLTRHGTLAVIEASAERFQLRWRSQLLSGTCWTHPVCAGGRLIVRDADGNLVSLDIIQGQ
ncbi:MAG: PQQ-binding-like beta-propeller repeat protein [Planctomycetota bacterium]